MQRKVTCLLGRGQGGPLHLQHELARVCTLWFLPVSLPHGLHACWETIPPNLLAFSGDEGRITLPQTVSGFSRCVGIPRIRTLGTLVGVTASTSGTRGTRMLDCHLSCGSSAALATPLHAGTIAAILLGRQRSVRNKSNQEARRLVESPAWGRTNWTYQRPTQVRPIPHMETQPPISFSAWSHCTELDLLHMWLWPATEPWGPVKFFGKD
jgi:hypothetical protein